MGQVGQAFSNPNTFAPSPSGFSGSEWAARLMGGAGKGLAQGYSGMQQQQPRQGGAPMAGGYEQAPAIMPQIYDPTKKSNSGFYGQ